MAQDRQTYARATTAASIGFFVQLLLGVIVALTGLYAQSPTVAAAAWQFFGGLLIWGMLWMLYFQHQQERHEALETQRLADADDTAASIFEEAGESLATARKRLNTLYRVGLGIVSLTVAIYLLAAGGAMLYGGWSAYQAIGSFGAMQAVAPGSEFGLLIVIFFLTAFTAFLTARYIAGMTHLAEWQALRGGASYLMGNFLVGAFLTAASVEAFFGGTLLFAIGAVAVPALLVLLGVEVTLGLLFSVYRPRKPGEFVRPSFDSRLLGALTRPESIGKIVTETINYQFGFEISRSWFYQLLAKAITPLCVLLILAVLGMTSVIVVQPHQKAIVTTWGGHPRVVDAGLSFKWPWPMGRVEKHDFYRIHEVRLGSRMHNAQEDVALLWTNQHVEGNEKEQYLVVAPTPAASTDDEANVQATLVAGEFAGGDVMVKYRINDLLAYTTQASDPVALLEAVAAREVANYFATHDIDAMLTNARLSAGEELKRRIADALQRTGGIETNGPNTGIGLEVVYVSVSGVHPPQDVADAFLQQIDALQEKQSLIEDARKEAIATLAAVAGSRDRALAISEAIDELAAMRQRDANQSGDGQGGDGAGRLSDESSELLAKAAQIEELLDRAGGSAAQALLEAKAYRWSHAIGELARAERFRSELFAYRQAPEYYRQRLYLDTLAEALADRNKIIIDNSGTDEAASPTQDPVIRLDLKQADTSLDSLIGE